MAIQCILYRVVCFVPRILLGIYVYIYFIADIVSTLSAKFPWNETLNLLYRIWMYCILIGAISLFYIIMFTQYSPARPCYRNVGSRCLNTGHLFIPDLSPTEQLWDMIARWVTPMTDNQQIDTLMVEWLVITAYSELYPDQWTNTRY